MGIYKRTGQGTEVWHLRYWDADGKLVRRSSRTRNKDEAAAMLAEAEAEMARQKRAKLEKGGHQRETDDQVTAVQLAALDDRLPAAERVALTLADHRVQGSKLMPVDLERACQGRTATDIDDLQSFVTSGAGTHLDLIRKMRAVLETHCWTTYPSAFQAREDWLGDIARKMREGGAQHPAWDLYDELDQIND